MNDEEYIYDDRITKYQLNELFGESHKEDVHGFDIWHMDLKF